MAATQRAYSLCKASPLPSYRSARKSVLTLGLTWLLERPTGGMNCRLSAGLAKTRSGSPHLRNAVCMQISDSCSLAPIQPCRANQISTRHREIGGELHSLTIPSLDKRLHGGSEGRQSLPRCRERKHTAKRVFPLQNHWRRAEYPHFLCGGTKRNIGAPKKNKNISRRAAFLRRPSVRYEDNRANFKKQIRTS